MVTINPKRIAKHLICGGALKRSFPAATLAAIEEAINASEKLHSGEIRCVIEASLDMGPLLKNQSAPARALELFSTLGIWDTKHNNGVLIYLLLADHAVEIVVDRGVTISTEALNSICLTMQSQFTQHNFAAGIIQGINAISVHLIRNFPAKDNGANEIPDNPILL
ncbi:MAG TPA: TPM domain-containing protein [Cellvibrionaceae bacterium]